MESVVYLIILQSQCSALVRGSCVESVVYLIIRQSQCSAPVRGSCVESVVYLIILQSQCSAPVRGCGICRILDHPSVTMFSTCERLASKTLLMTAHVTALLTLLGLAVDHYLAICRPLYHRTDLNVSRVNIAVFVVWIASFSCCLLDIILPVKHHFFSCTVSGICSFTTAVKVVSYCIVRRYL